MSSPLLSPKSKQLSRWLLPVKAGVSLALIGIAVNVHPDPVQSTQSTSGPQSPLIKNSTGVSITYGPTNVATREDLEKAKSDLEKKMSELEEARNLRNLLTPGNEVVELPIPPGRPNDVPQSALSPAKDEVVILLGDFAVSTAESSFTVLKLYGRDLIKVTMVGERARISANIWAEDGRILATLDDQTHILRVNPHNTIPILRPDAHTLLVDDEGMNRVLSVHFLNPTTLRIGGIFRAAGKYSVQVGDHDIRFGPVRITQGFCFHVKGREAIFDWPGKVAGSKKYLAPTESIAADKAVLWTSENNGALNLMITQGNGFEYSLLQIGGHDLSPGTVIWAAMLYEIQR